jgi:hypothetical protein
MFDAPADPYTRMLLESTLDDVAPRGDLLAEKKGA